MGTTTTKNRQLALAMAMVHRYSTGEIKPQSNDSLSIALHGVEHSPDKLGVEVLGEPLAISQHVLDLSSHGKVDQSYY